MSDKNSKNKRLPLQAIDELANVAGWLQSEEAEFQKIDNINICNNTKGLSDITNDLIKQFATEITPAPSETRVTAIHFDQSAVVPVEKGWTVYFIPVHIFGDVVMVDGQPLEVDYYRHLDKNVRVSGNFLAVLLLSHQ